MKPRIKKISHSKIPGCEICIGLILPQAFFPSLERDCREGKLTQRKKVEGVLGKDTVLQHPWGTAVWSLEQTFKL